MIGFLYKCEVKMWKKRVGLQRAAGERYVRRRASCPTACRAGGSCTRPSPPPPRSTCSTTRTVTPAASGRVSLTTVAELGSCTSTSSVIIVDKLKY